MVYNATIKKFFEYSLRCARGSGFINNVYFSSNLLKLYLAIFKKFFYSSVINHLYRNGRTGFNFFGVTLENLFKV